MQDSKAKPEVVRSEEAVGLMTEYGQMTVGGQGGKPVGRDRWLGCNTSERRIFSDPRDKAAVSGKTG